MFTRIRVRVDRENERYRVSNHANACLLLKPVFNQNTTSDVQFLPWCNRNTQVTTYNCTCTRTWKILLTQHTNMFPLMLSWLICIKQSKFSNSYAKVKHFKTSISLQSWYHTSAMSKQPHKHVKERCDNIVMKECRLWLECWLWVCKNKVTNMTCLVGLFANLDRVRTSSVFYIFYLQFI